MKERPIQEGDKVRLKHQQEIAKFGMVVGAIFIKGDRQFADCYWLSSYGTDIQSFPIPIGALEHDDGATTPS